MIRLFERSLLLRLGIAMAGITLLALIGMGSSVIIAEMMRGEATAINQAGSLRMQAYIIAARLLAPPRDVDYDDRVSEAVRAFDRRLESPRLTDVLSGRADAGLALDYERIVATWRGGLRPEIVSYLALATTAPETTRVAARGRILTRVDGFVLDIDRIVKRLEDGAEAKIDLLRLIQGFSLFLTFAVAYATMYLTYRDVVAPFKDLLAFAERARRGDFSLRPQHTGEDELGRLGHAFDVMADDLSKLYRDLETRVAEKTADLARSNRSLELLYRTTRRLNETPLSPPLYVELLRDIERTIGLGPGSVCITNPDGRSAQTLASTFCPDSPDACPGTSCDACLQHQDARASTNGRLLFLPLRDQERVHGMLTLHIPSGTTPEPWQIQVVDTLAHHVGVALGTAQRQMQSRRLALFEERSAIARELHDSLAQSLAYMKIQLGRLRALGPNESESVMAELRTAVNDAYRQLRELIATFRLKMDGRGLHAALADAVAEFRARACIPIALDDSLPPCPLSVNEEIHVLQIVREALSNVARHAQAHSVQVRLNCDENRMVTVSVSDDGIGIATPVSGHHYGMAIMEERAHTLGGNVSVDRRPQGGTEVRLRFTPANYTAAMGMG